MQWSFDDAASSADGFVVQFRPAGAGDDAWVSFAVPDPAARQAVVSIHGTRTYTQRFLLCRVNRSSRKKRENATHAPKPNRLRQTIAKERAHTCALSSAAGDNRRRRHGGQAVRRAGASRVRGRAERTKRFHPDHHRSASHVCRHAHAHMPTHSFCVCVCVYVSVCLSLSLSLSRSIAHEHTFGTYTCRATVQPELLFTRASFFHTLTSRELSSCGGATRRVFQRRRVRWRCRRAPTTRPRPASSSPGSCCPTRRRTAPSTVGGSSTRRR